MTAVQFLMVPLDPKLFPRGLPDQTDGILMVEITRLPHARLAEVFVRVGTSKKSCQLPIWDARAAPQLVRRLLGTPGRGPV